MTLGIEPLPFVSTDVILGTLGMTDKHQDVFTPKREKIGAGAILVGIGPASVRFIKRMDVFPMNKIGGLKQIGNIAVRLRRRIRFVAANRVVCFPLDPTAGIPDMVYAIIRFTRSGYGNHWISGMFVPVDQLIILTSGNASTSIYPMVNHGGYACFVDQRTTGVNLLFRISGGDTQGDWMVSPVQQVRAGGMSPETNLLDLIGVEEMVSPSPVDTPLGIEGVTDAFGRYKVILRSMRIRLVLLPQFPRTTD